MKQLLSVAFVRKFIRLGVCLILLSLALSFNAYGGFLYVYNETGNSIYGYSVNERTGALTPLAGFPLAVAGTGGPLFSSESMNIDAVNKRLYVIADGANTVNVFSINPLTGALSALPFSPILLPNGLHISVKVNPTGSLIAVDDEEHHATYIYVITPTSATLAQTIPFTSFSNRESGFSRDGNYFYRSSCCTIGFSGFSINAATGIATLLPGSPFRPTAGMGFETDSQGRIFGVSTDSLMDIDVRVFTTNQGVPTLVDQESFDYRAIADGALHPSGKFYTFAERSFNSVQSVQIDGDGANTTLTAIFPAVAARGFSTNALVFNQAGNFLFTTNQEARNITTFNFNRETGVPTFNNVQPVGTNGDGQAPGIAYLPTGIAVFLSGRVTDANGRPISGAVITATSPQDGIVHTARTNPFGYYTFEELITGRTYTLEIRQKQFAFATQTFTPNQEFNELNFTAAP
ncbi:MAG TPA: carboxypeptidase regulatory-like domain-containing protein [Pyrinomonadaceae bacterium]|jgi:6-phosphogluconolactonase (cycloisomerase 2 family)